MQFNQKAISRGVKVQKVTKLNNLGHILEMFVGQKINILGMGAKKSDFPYNICYYLNVNTHAIWLESQEDCQSFRSRTHLVNYKQNKTTDTSYSHLSWFHVFVEF